ncbi:PQQ-dependent sugar dehydrogenase [Roseovarius sp. M141]|uniref:PQQ-dependent sugar dehydrogenase n=1 Tax=Roseovarius sp. M141 TaxID=2583806 RepID=UPI0020CEBE0B|nr:PQQ-dependent sugar dehydrogenase [Roseovarius sp. M141]MCQ0093007.1 PQQ-dependent sugar dehydrogenase [Roseovarius sp. M141]
MRYFRLLLAVLWLAAPLGAQTLDGPSGPLRVTQMADALNGPWAFGFLPDGSVLITEKRGHLWRLSEGRKSAVGGVGPVADIGQGGLLDILVPRDFAQTRQLYFTQAIRQGRGTGTALATARLERGANTLTDWRVLYQIAAGSRGGRHFGSRLVEAPDGTLFMTVGERGDRPSAQDLGRENGSVLRLTRSGDPAPENPFTSREGASPAIWSYGHRNPQGASLDTDGNLWITEHGAKGGDEVNLIAKGANYGWPVISYGRHYSGGKIGEGTAKPGMEQPAFYWDPSIAPSGLMVYSGQIWPEWQGDFFAGSLKFGFISRLSGDPLREAQRLQGPETARVRDIREAPDGTIWFLSEGNGALYRLSP